MHVKMPFVRGNPVKPTPAAGGIFSCGLHMGRTVTKQSQIAIGTAIGTMVQIRLIKTIATMGATWQTKKTINYWDMGRRGIRTYAPPCPSFGSAHHL